jgi:hypothetical protein
MSAVVVSARIHSRKSPTVQPLISVEDGLVDRVVDHARHLVIVVGDGWVCPQRLEREFGQHVARRHAFGDGRAAIPACRSPDFSSLALASTSLTEPNS